MKKVKAIDNSDFKNHYYLLHHAFIKESTTIKLCIVSALTKISNGKPLSEQMLTGLTIHLTLRCTLLNCRQHKYVQATDIEKMYRMIHMKLS